jgi:hypothetical protein
MVNLINFERNDLGEEGIDLGPKERALGLTPDP